MTTRFRLRPILRVARRLWPALLVAALLSGLVATLVLDRLAPDHNAEVRALLLISGYGGDTDELDDSVELIWMNADVAERAVILGELDATGSQLRDDLAIVDGLDGTPLVQVTALGSDPDVLVRTANAVADALAVTVNDSGALGSMRVLQPATTELVESPATLPVVPLAIFAAVLGALGLLGLYILLQEPVLELADLRLASNAPVVTTAWIDVGPPAIGGVRSATEHMADMGLAYRLTQADWGEDLTLPFGRLLWTMDPRLELFGLAGSTEPTSVTPPPVPGTSDAYVVGDDGEILEPEDEVDVVAQPLLPVPAHDWAEVLIVNEGTPARSVARAETTLDGQVLAILVRRTPT